MKSDSPFCILPWIHAATYTDGSALLCCVAHNSRQLNLNRMSWDEIWNSEHFRNARLSMIDGKKFRACTNCYKEEDAGIRSHRENENNLWKRKLGEEYLDQLVSNTKSDGSIDTDIITVDFRLGNTCNLQCIMCRPQDSSKWLNHAKVMANELTTDAKYDWKVKADIAIDDFDWYKNTEFWESFYESCGNIRHIIFGGGEPLLIKEHMTLIQQLVARGYSKNIEIRYHTNGTILSEEMIELWSHFKLVEIMISIDGYNDINSFIRHPADWKTIEKNLQRYDNTPSNIDPKILCTVQALNIEWLPEFADWLISQNYKKISHKHHSGVFHPGILHWPQYYCTKVLSKSDKDRITEKLLAYADTHADNIAIQKFRNLIDFMNAEDWSHLLPQTFEVTQKIETMRGIKYSSKLMQ